MRGTLTKRTSDHLGSGAKLKLIRIIIESGNLFDNPVGLVKKTAYDSWATVPDKSDKLMAFDYILI